MLKTTGFVGIGTTSPARTLDVAGDVRLTGSIYSNAATMYLLTDASAALGAKVGSLAITSNYSANSAPTNGLYVLGNVRVASLAAASATAVCRDANNDLSTCSSSRLFKTDINTFTAQHQVLEAIAGTPLYTFRMRDEPASAPSHLGILAEEAPAGLRVTDEHGNPNIDHYSYQAGYPWAAIQALYRKVQELERQGAEAERRAGEAAVLRERLARLEAAQAPAVAATPARGGE